MLVLTENSGDSWFTAIFSRAMFLTEQLRDRKYRTAPEFPNLELPIDRQISH
jgi:hypothetical protein